MAQGSSSSPAPDAHQKPAPFASKPVSEKLQKPPVAGRKGRASDSKASRFDAFRKAKV
ncbi:hypothetical protein JL722_9874 [Aureococcus anophagefferens]|nr:hypothetical protein JL722_9874 [Aureococcus anophagefferens]